MDAIPDVSDTILGITEPMQLLALLMVCVVVMFYLATRGRVNKVELLEQERTKVRKMARDKQIAEIVAKMNDRATRLEGRVSETEAILDRHIAWSGDKDNEIFQRLNAIEKTVVGRMEFRDIERDVNDMAKRIIELDTIIKSGAFGNHKPKGGFT